LAKIALARTPAAKMILYMIVWATSIGYTVLILSSLAATHSGVPVYTQAGELSTLDAFRRQFDDVAFEKVGAVLFCSRVFWREKTHRL
jgi:hypothetical protein